MKTPSSFLWQLIQSLDASEKRYFKRNFLSAKEEAPVYLHLFDAVAAQREYDEAAILKKYGPRISKKNIAGLKQYLHQLLCEALTTYNKVDDPAHELYYQVQLIRVYRKKGLIDEAHQVWKKAVKKARQIESFALLNLLKSEFEKMILSANPHTSYDELHSLFRGNVISYPEYAELITLRDIYAETILLKRLGHFDMDTPQRDKIKKLLDKAEQYSAAIQSRSFWLRHYYLAITGTLRYLLNRGAEAFTIFSNLLGDWKESPSFIRSHPEHYIELLHMINYTGVLQGEFAFVENAFNDPCNELIRDPVQKAGFEANKYLALNRIYNKTARYNEVARLLAHMKANLSTWERQLNDDMNRTVSLSLGIGSFVMEQLEDAHFYTKRAITYFRDGTREEHAAVAQVLLLLITYCMNNARLFDAQYRSTYTYFYKRKKKHPFEAALVRCLHNTFYQTDYRKKVQEYEKALQVFEENKEDQVQQSTITIFNYPGWLESRAQRIPYRHYVETKVKKQQR